LRSELEVRASGSFLSFITTSVRIHQPRRGDHDFLSAAQTIEFFHLKKPSKGAATTLSTVVCGAVDS
jgi:hypothetical protein